MQAWGYGQALEEVSESQRLSGGFSVCEKTGEGEGVRVVYLSFILTAQSNLYT